MKQQPAQHIPTYDVLHDFTDHATQPIFAAEASADEMTREELAEAIRESAQLLRYFRENILSPVLAELQQHREKTWREEK